MPDSLNEEMTILGRSVTDIMVRVSPEGGQLRVWRRSKSGHYCANISMDNGVLYFASRETLPETLVVLNRKIALGDRTRS